MEFIGIWGGMGCYCYPSVADLNNPDRCNDMCNIKCMGDSTTACGGRETITVWRREGKFMAMKLYRCQLNNSM